MRGVLNSRGSRIAGGAIAVVAMLLLVLAAFPWGVLRGTFESYLTQRFGRPVSIATVRRIDSFGFTPVIAITEIRIPQPAWVGQGDFVRLARAQASFPLWPLLMGELRPRDIRVTGLRLALARDAQGRTNWTRPGKEKGGGAATDLKGLTVTDSVISYRDAKRDRRIIAHFSADAQGLRATGGGTIRGTAVRIGFHGPSVERADLGRRPWPFTATIDGAALAITARGAMDRPLDTDHMTFDATARGDNLKLIDSMIEAGLFDTQPIAFAAHIRHDDTTWKITGLKGTVGRSDFAGAVMVRKVDGRTKVDASVTAHRMDFADLSSTEGQAKGAALERAIGPRLVPDLRVDLSHIRTTDGVIRVGVAQVFSAKGRSSIRSVRGTLTMDHQRLTVAPLTLGLERGTASGRVVVDQRGGAPAPRVTINLRLQGSDVAALVGGGGSFTGRVAGRVALVGVGATIRAAVGQSDGAIGLVARDGGLPEKIADAIGFDAGRALFAGEDDQAGLRCAVVRLDLRHGRGRLDPLIVDTTQSQLVGQGFVTFPDERLAVTLTGAPKRGSILRLPGAATMAGTIKLPDLVIPHQVKSVGNIFKAIGRAITGRQGPIATDTDCDALTARALR